MAPKEKEEPTTHDNSYGTMADDGDVGMTPVISQAGMTNKYDNGSSNPQYNPVSIESAIEKVGTGAFQYKILLAAGLCFMADAMEVLLLSFLSTVLKHEWNLSEGQVDSIVAVVFVGALLGTLVLGTAGDVWGRKPVFFVTSGLIAIAGVATAFCQTYQHLLIARFWVGFGVGGLTVPFDTLGEFLPGAARGTNLLYIEFFWTAGTLSVPALAYLTLDTSAANGGSHWQLFVILCSIPCFLSAFLGLVLVPESPRWLLEQGSGEKALEILKAAAHSNGISQTKIDKEIFPPNTKLVLSMEKAKATNNATEHDKSKNNLGSFGELFRTPHQTRITLLLWATWFGFGFLYYGVIIAVSLVFTNEDEESSYYDDAYIADDDQEIIASYGFDFSAIFITASAEVFGLIVVLGTVDTLGRIPSQSMAYRIGGVSTFVLGILCVVWIENGTTLRRISLITLAFVSRMAMMASSCVTWVSTSEMLSTEIRSTGHGAANAMARLGGFIAPYVITEGNSMGTIGILVLLVSLLTAEFASKLPETAGRPMGDVSEAPPKQTNGTPTPTINEPATSYHEFL